MASLRSMRIVLVPLAEAVASLRTVQEADWEVARAFLG